MTRFARHIPRPDSISRAESRVQLAMLLVNATDKRFATFTPELIARLFNVPLSEIADMLERERGRRGFAS